MCGVILLERLQEKFELDHSWLKLSRVFLFLSVAFGLDQSQGPKILFLNLFRLELVQNRIYT